MDQRGCKSTAALSAIGTLLRGSVPKASLHLNPPPLGGEGWRGAAVKLRSPIWTACDAVGKPNGNAQPDSSTSCSLLKMSGNERGALPLAVFAMATGCGLPIPSSGPCRRLHRRLRLSAREGGG